MLNQRADLLTQRLNLGQASANYEHVNDSKDLLHEVKEKYDDLAKNNHFPNEFQVSWELRIIENRSAELSADNTQAYRG